MHGKVTFFGTLRIGNYNQRLRTATTKTRRHKDELNDLFSLCAFSVSFVRSVGKS